jgi:hypothetical protein
VQGFPWQDEIAAVMPSQSVRGLGRGLRLIHLYPARRLGSWRRDHCDSQISGRLPADRKQLRRPCHQSSADPFPNRALARGLE